VCVCVRVYSNEMTFDVDAWVVRKSCL